MISLVSVEKLIVFFSKGISLSELDYNENISLQYFSTFYWVLAQLRLIDNLCLPYVDILKSNENCPSHPFLVM